jgi:hypothetical protein
MKKLKEYIDKCDNVFISVKGQDKLLIGKNEMVEFVTRVFSASFVNRSQATRLTNISYLGGVDVSAKIKKGQKLNVATYVMYLQSYKSLFGNTCAKGQNCYAPCLMTSGRVKMDIKEFKILRARYFRTILFYVNRDYFNRWLFAEIDAHSKLHDSFMVRLNATSDLSPLLFKVDSVNVLDAFQDVQFYDYTKISKRAELIRNNYHLTFSFDGYNMDECLEMMSRGINVAIVVDGSMPEKYMGVEVFSMDETDLRPLDEQKGKFGYLKLKETLNKMYDTKFILRLA